MRKRNIEFTKNIGELIEEIKTQDLEIINGGEDNDNAVNVSVTVTVSLPCIPGMPTHISVVTQKFECGEVNSITKECGCVIIED